MENPDIKYLESLVFLVTKDLSSARPGIGGKTLETMQRLFSQGYILDVKSPTHKATEKYFPRINIAVIEKKHICYLNEKAKDAANGVSRDKKKKVLSYQELKSITPKVFDVELLLK